MDTLVWFGAQVLLAAAGVALAPALARRPRPEWATACVLAFAAMLAWPLMRFFPGAAIGVLGAPTVACLELTGLAIPAALLFSVAGAQLPRASDRRALRLLLVVCAVYFLKAGWWMVAPVVGIGGVPDLGPTRFERGVCRQTTGYTCVASSLVTALRAHGIDAQESEMARLSRTQVGGGATDSRALWALQEKLAGTGLAARYAALDRAGLVAVPKPCLVQLNWGFFTSHMVPVLAADEWHVTIGDPLAGRRTVSWETFLREWKGQAIVIDAAPAGA
ncbi:MAG TPA: cysteine peptidase family C39 domain-containing protein [Phycisphaerales bacterium]|nr:cysteine peptidase family C39 domain-containing protein [Phycisphaerales bacterium]